MYGYLFLIVNDFISYANRSLYSNDCTSYCMHTSAVLKIADPITLSSRLFYGCFTVITVFYNNNSKCLQNLLFGRFLECTPVSYALYYCA